MKFLKTLSRSTTLGIAEIFTAGPYIGTLSIVDKKGYLSYRYYDLTDIELDDITCKIEIDIIIKNARDFCTKYEAKLWSY